jgi:hypothetical protein
MEVLTPFDTVIEGHLGKAFRTVSFSSSSRRRGNSLAQRWWSTKVGETGRECGAGAAALSLAAVVDGMSREEAAEIGAMDRQTLRDWVHRFNASFGRGPGALPLISPAGPFPDDVSEIDTSPTHDTIRVSTIRFNFVSVQASKAEFLEYTANRHFVEIDVEATSGGSGFMAPRMPPRRSCVKT